MSSIRYVMQPRDERFYGGVSVYHSNMLYKNLYSMVMFTHPMKSQN